MVTSSLESYPYTADDGMPRADIMMLPPHSFDFNPMTKLWNRLEERIKYSRWNPPASNVTMLENDVMDMWQELWGQDHYFQEVIDQIPVDLQKIVDADGGLIN